MNSPTAADLEPTALTKHNRTSIQAALTVPSDGDGASTLGETVTRAEVVARAHPDHQVILVIFSDFELSDDITVLTAALTGFPGEVHAVVMRSQPPQQLLDSASITVTHVETGAEPGPVARALFDAMTRHRPGRRLTAPAKKGVKR